MFWVAWYWIEMVESFHDVRHSQRTVCPVLNATVTAARRSQLPRGLRRRSAAARLLGSRVRIPLGHGCLSVVLSCVGRGLCDGLITHPEVSYRVSNCMCDQETPKGALCSIWYLQENEWWWTTTHEPMIMLNSYKRNSLLQLTHCLQWVWPSFQLLCR
jgi:hypothetical protein